jgi:hypothetical protein
MTIIVGISGFAGVGKDTAGNALAKLGWSRHSFADPLRESCSIVTGVSIDVFNDTVLKNIPRDDLYGKTPREVLQLIGTEGWRTLISESIWVDAFLKQATKSDSHGVYTCDVRFNNEADAIANAGGLLIHISRPGKDAPEFLHQSETEIPSVMKKAHCIILNNSTPENLESNILGTIKQWKMRNK